MGQLARFARGFGYGFRGLSSLRRHPEWARYWLPPVLLTVAVFVALQWMAAHWFDELRDAVWQGPARELCQGAPWYSWPCLLSPLSKVAYWFSGLFAWLLAAAAAFLCAFLFAALLSAPFNDALSEAVERARGVSGHVPFSLGEVLRDAGRSLVLEATKLALFAGLMAPLFLLSWLLPVVGQVLYTAAGGLLTVSYLSLEFVDWCAARRAWSAKRRLGLLRQEPGLLFGFGLAAWVLLWVPILGFFLMPAAVIGGTLLFLDLEEESKTP